MKKHLEFWSNDRFNHQWLEHDHTIEQINPPDGSRYYLVDDQLKLPSVTRVLGSKSNSHIDSWIAAVGKDEAARVSKRATDRGSNLHENTENYLLNHRVCIDPRRMMDVQMFRSFIPFLDRIQNIRILEDPVFSRIFSCAGTIDCVAEFDGQLSIIDFKTSNHMKTKEEIESYWIQTSVYSYAIEEMTKIKIPDIVILMAVEGMKPIIFKDTRNNYKNQLVDFRQQALLLTEKISN